ncbi:SDR family oxidoreductase [Rhizobium sp. SG741]|uniref:SDR family NAD(P)-dependent oxidoreductase n=1 Tax=Rhizobium sp. SG741 TaxID=2587114 RepID=UPI00144761CE|nr:SDR family oxidoreductase [Rhizobium sp. SG741]NKJ08948.1 NAD(P)-dependent dehydrogenase (short-subunit alcohol dehydrogenase family) [Rhizobium sp. SG741]
MNRFQSKRVIVTGAAQGIGLACVERLLAEGACVLAADIQEWEGSAASSVLQLNERLAFKQTDVTSREAVDAMVQEAVAKFGGADVLISNVGVAKRTAFLDLTEDDLVRGLQINVLSGILCSQSFLRQIQLQGTPGAIVHMSSVNGVMAMPGYTIYNISKGAIEQLTRVMALEFAPLGVRVNAVGPGTILTDMVRTNVLTDEASRRMLLSRTPLGRFGEPEDVAAVVAFLASDDAAYVSGETVFIDGGRRALNYVVPVAD